MRRTTRYVFREPESGVPFNSQTVAGVEICYGDDGALLFVEIPHGARSITTVEYQ